jgi:dTDP-4-amino-4,6-dideoxygalactose transaminase
MMIPLAIPDISGNEGRYLQDCVTTGMVSSVGPFVTRFEEHVGRAAGFMTDPRGHAVATSAGTTGLHSALLALGVGQGDLVIAPSLTFIATANAIAHAGAVPWLVDVDVATWTLEPEGLATLLETETERDTAGVLRRRICGRRVAGVMPVYTMGHPPDMPALVGLARHYGLSVVSDCAAALGAEIDGAPVATHGADLSVFSFNGNKTVTSGGGGGVVGADTELIAHLRHLTTTARVGMAYDHDAVGFNYRMTNIQAAVGCAQMERLGDFLAAKKRIAEAYRAAFADLADVASFSEAPRVTSAHWLSGLYLGASRIDPGRVRGALRDRGIDVRPFWKPVHLQRPYAEAPRGPLAVTEAIWDRIMPLPCSTALSAKDQAFVIDAVREVLRQE